MSTYTSKNMFQVQVGKTGSFEALATVQITDPTLGTFIDDGQIVAINADSGAVLAAGQTISDVPAIKLVQRSGSVAASANLRFSNRIDGQNVYQYKGRAGVAATELVKTLGYNGTSGAIDTTAANTFSVRVTYTFDESMWSEQQDFNYVTYVAPSTPVQANIAAAITCQLVAGVYPRGGTLVLVERLCNDAGVALAGTLTVRNGSNQVVESASSGFVAGDYIRIGGTTTTTPVYRITEVAADTVTLTLDCAYQGASGTGIAGEDIASALGQAADWGIRFTGQALTWSLDPYGVFKYLQMDFLIQPVGFGDTPNNTLTAKVYPVNAYEQVAQMSAFAQGFEGALNRNLQPLPNYVNDAVASTLYDCITIQYADTTDISVISGTKPSLQDLYLYIADTAAQQAILRGQLNPWMASTPGAFPPLAL